MYVDVDLDLDGLGEVLCAADYFLICVEHGGAQRSLLATLDARPETD